MKKKDKLEELLNLNYLKLTNKTISCGKIDLPAINCNISVPPDYIALYSQQALYHKTDHTAVAFFEYDNTFDGKNGLYWAIYYNVKDRLEIFKKRFENVSYVILPDYSELGDVHIVENMYRLFKGRVVGLWFVREIGSIVIPNITISSFEMAKFAMDGYENCTAVAISTKGHMHDLDEMDRLRKNVRLVVDRLSNLKMIIIYDVCSTNKATLDMFSYAVDKGIKLVIPDNTLKLRNTELYRIRHNKGVKI